jgi:hypothetical protein
VEDLVGVDVADAGDDVLVEQERFQEASTRPQHLAELPERDLVGDRVGPEVRDVGHLDGSVRRVEHHHLAEGSGVDEPELVAVVEVEHDVGVHRPR